MNHFPDVLSILLAGLTSVGSFLLSFGALLVTRTVANITAIGTGFSEGGTAAVYAVPSIIVLAAEATILYGVWRVLRMVWFLSHETRVFHHKKIQRYSSPGRGGKRILVVGDSTAYGMGADKPEDSIAGRLGHDFPSAEIVNTGINGSLTKSALAQLRGAEGQFDLVVVLTGGNDVWHLTSYASIERDLATLLAEAVQKSGHEVVVLFYSNFENISFFPGPIRSLLARRSKRIHEIFARVTAAYQTPLIELYTDPAARDPDNPFAYEPERYYAGDRVHPSSEGYRLWYNRMWREMVERHFTFTESALPGAINTAPPVEISDAPPPGAV